MPDGHDQPNLDDAGDLATLFLSASAGGGAQPSDRERPQADGEAAGEGG